MVVMFFPSRSERRMEPSFALGLPILVQYICPATLSTTRPSGIFLPSSTIVLRSEPSGFADKTRPPATSRKKRRPTLASSPDAVLGLAACRSVIAFPSILSVGRRCLDLAGGADGSVVIAAAPGELVAHAAARSKAQRVSHSFLLGPQVGQRLGGRRRLTRNLRGNFDAGVSYGANLARIVRQKADPPDVEIAQDRDRQTEIPVVRLESEGPIGLNGVDAGVLQLIGLQLRHQADASTLLIFVNHHATPFIGDSLQGHCKLVATIAGQRAQRLAGEALRMKAQQRPVLAQIAHDNRERRFYSWNAACGLALEPEGVEHTPLGGHARRRNAPEH